MCLKLADAGGKGNTQLIYMNNFDKIIDKIAAEAEEKIAAVRAKAEREISELNEGCENKINDMRRMNGERIERECAMIASRAESAASMKRREVLLRARVGLIDRAYTNAEEYICSLPEEDYVSFLSHLLSDAVNSRLDEAAELAEHYGEEADCNFEVIFNSADREKLSERVLGRSAELLGKRGKDISVSVAEETADIRGGLILRYGDIETNCSVKAVISSLRADTESEVVKVLFS